MNWNYRELLPAGFAADSKVWIYQGSRSFTMEEAVQVENLLKQFAASWLSHGAKVKGFAQLFFNRFIIIMADEEATGVSGCSTDSSVRLIKQIEQQFNVNMFDRQTLAFAVNESIQVIPLAQLQSAIDDNIITHETLYFNNLVQTKAEWETKWLIPLKDSWLAKRVESRESGARSL